MEYKLLKSHSLWFTGYPSSGKSTLAKLLKQKLKPHNLPVIILDGDEIRKKFLKTYKYNKSDRISSVNFYILLVKKLMEINILVVVAANHALNQQRHLARKSLKEKYSEIWISSSLKTCKKRDVKGLYKKAKKKKLINLIGQDLKFDIPKRYDYKIKTDKLKKENCVNKLLNFLIKKKILIK
tara:strand:+ start:273 stop:818 length:546 start_codon:yes stop_codon:yes gene_type:complete